MADRITECLSVCGTVDGQRISRKKRDIRSEQQYSLASELNLFFIKLKASGHSLSCHGWSGMSRRIYSPKSKLYEQSAEVEEPKKKRVEPGGARSVRVVSGDGTCEMRQR